MVPEAQRSARSLPLSGLRLGVFGKGGAGKSTVVVLLARALRRRGYSVIVLDADSTNVGLAGALGVEREPEPLLGYFGGMVFSGGPVTCPVDDPRPLAGANIALEALPSACVGRSSDGVCLLVAGKLGPLGPGAACDGPIAKIARDLRIGGAGAGHVVVVDFKAGFEDSARGAITTLDWALAVVDPTQAALQMAIHLQRLVEQVRAGVPPATRHLDRPELVELALRQFREAPVRGVRAVLNRVGSAATEAFLLRELAAGGASVLAALREDPAIQDQWLRGTRLESPDLELEATRLAEWLEESSRETATPTASTRVR
jgi:CO dehydrogenase nickel-insertion accessory protein CooC1